MTFCTCNMQRDLTVLKHSSFVLMLLKVSILETDVWLRQKLSCLLFLSWRVI